MKALFVESCAFEKQRETLLNDEEYRALQNILIFNATAGDVIKGTGGLRKIRVSAKGHGKRGGARIIYYYLDTKHRFYMLLIYPKNEKDDLTVEQKRQLKSFMEDWKNEQ